MTGKSAAERFNLPRWDKVQQAMGFAQAVKSGNILRISGTASLDQDFGPLHSGDMAAQTKEVYDAIGATLKAFDADFSHVVREIMYVTDMDGLLDCVELRKSYYGDGPYPASTAVEIRRLVHRDLMIEVQVDAELPQ
jgi:2-iminobutanoate/2-iminopropanoate deaminase